MKKALLLFLLIACATSIFCQDIIVTKDASRISAKILEVSPTEVRYKKYNNIDGPTFVILKREIHTILYENGDVDVCEKQAESSDKYNEEEYSRPFIKSAYFNCYPELMGVISNGNECAYHGCTFGARMNDYVFFGFGIGVEYMKYMDYNDNYRHKENFFVPFNWDLRLFYPINRNIHPFVDFLFGCAMGGDNYPIKLMIGQGFEFARFSLSLGYAYYKDRNSFSYFKSHNIYLKLGVKIGKR